MPQTLEADQEQVRNDNVVRILAAAERLFRHYGYAKTTVADIAKDLGMSPANIYRFFASKVEIHQALCARMLNESLELAKACADLPLSAEERLRRYSMGHYQYTVETMLDAEKVHEMVIVAIERDWHVVDEHIDQLQAIVRGIIADGMKRGEFAAGDAELATRCFGAATSALHHPQLVAQCIGKANRASAAELTEFAIQALKP
jgi:AcrR family transcriptional regulator